MKRYTAVLLTVLIAAALWSCTRSVTVDSAPPSVAVTVSVPPTPEVSPSEQISAAQAFLAGEPDLGAVGDYILEKAAQLTAEETDLLLERLLLLQLDVSMDINLKIWDEPYLTALNSVMGGVLDPDKIQDIEDAAVRADFQMLSDGFMTVVRYEETPAVETDWTALLDLKDSFSPAAARLVELESHLRSGYYIGGNTGLDFMAADIVAVENELAGTDTGFVRWQLKALYARLVETLLFGPEGEYLSDFTAGEEETVGRITRYSDDYGDTRFGQTCRNLLNMRKLVTDDLHSYSDAIVATTVFGPDDPRHIEIVTSESGVASLVYPYVAGDGDPAAAKKINTAIKDAAEALLKPTAYDQWVYSHSTVSGGYMSVTLSSSYMEEAENGYEEEHNTFDLNSGDTITLDDLVGRQLDEYKESLLEVMHGDKLPEELQAPVDYTLNGDGITIFITLADSEYPGYYSVTLNGLRGIMDIAKLY